MKTKTFTIDWRYHFTGGFAFAEHRAFVCQCLPMVRPLSEHGPRIFGHRQLFERWIEP